LLFFIVAGVAPDGVGEGALVLSTYVGTGERGNAREDENRYRAAIAEPYGLACDADGNLYLSDYENKRIRRIDRGSGRVTTTAEIPGPQSLALDGRGDLYAGSTHGVVWRVDLASGVAKVIAGGGRLLAADGAATEMALGAPAGVTVAPDGDIYIADANLHVILRLDADSGRLRVVAGRRGASGFAGDGAEATAALLATPADVEVDDSGNLYIADADNHVIRMVEAGAGTIRTIAGSPGKRGFSGDNHGGEIRFDWPQDLLLTDRGTLIIADVYNHRVRELELGTGTVRTLVGTGSSEYVGENIPPAESPLPYPVALAMDPAGTLYVSSPWGNRIFRLGGPSVVPKPWWLSPWAWLGSLVTLGLLIYCATELRAAQLRGRARFLEAEIQTRTSDLASQRAVVQQQANRLASLAATKDQVLARISTEFRRPLESILGSVDSMRHQAETLDERRYVDAVERNASRLLRLVDQMLALTPKGAGQIEPPSAVAALPLLQQIVASFEAYAADQRLALSVARGEPLMLKMTAEAFETIAANLLSNALKYTPPGGTVTVSLTADERSGLLSVSDTGRGIAADALERIFLPFERAHDEAERIPGSGLGLALVKELVQSHSGRVDVASTPGKGSTFRVHMALAGESSDASGNTVAVKELAATRAELAAMHSTGLAPDRVATPLGELPVILLAEDNRDMLRYLLDVLAPCYECHHSDDGRDAVAQAVSLVPDLVISDILLPGQDGFAVCRALKGDQRTCHIPVVLLTALDDRAHRLLGLQDQADDYLAKPFSEAELLQRMHNLLEVRSLLQRRYARDLRFDRGQPAGLDKRDGAFLAKLGRVVDRRHAEASLSVDDLAAALAVSGRQLQRKLKALIGLPPAEFLRDYRLQRAHERLLSGERPTTVAVATGFSTHSHFAACFKARFGFSPAEARQRARRTA
jgi:signal transduction histidine kinase/DNA-binding response OmpR family regulator/sugar lactone lactonase YvrE